MATLTENTRAGEFILSEANGNRSRDNVVISGGNYVAGTVLGKLTATGAYTEHDPGALDGSEAAAGILFAGVDASAADASGAIVSRDAEVDGDLLTYITGISTANRDLAIADLLAFGIIVR